LFPGVDVGDVDLDDRHPGGDHGVVDGERVVAERPGIQDHAVSGVAGVLEPVDDLALEVALAEVDLETQVLGQSTAHILKVVDGLVAVDVGLPFAEQVEIGTVEHEDLHAGSTERIARESSREGTPAVTNGSPIPLSSTHRIPPRYFLSMPHADSTA